VEWRFVELRRRHSVSQLSDLDLQSGRTVRRIVTSQPSELIHIDVKKQATTSKG
jgi:hypothetical protein